MLLDGGSFLGTRFRVARWHLAESGGIRPRPDTVVALDSALAIAPEYRANEALPAQAREFAAVRAALGDRLRLVAPTRSALRDAIRGARGGVLHFAGHGEIAAGERPQYVLRLADERITSDDWRGMMRAPGPLLVFLNACDLGQASRAAGIVDGWAPAVLDAGGAGYIGGMWPLADGAAADFAARFYAALERGAPVSEAVRAARRAFFETGDPTYLAYVFYGSPHLVLAPRR
jgi:CHAT domain-containing protein